MPKLLTKRKQLWANKFNPNILRGEPLNYNASSEMRYYDRLAKLVNQMTAEVEKELKELFDEPHAKEFFASDASVSSQARILTNALMKKFNDLFASVSKPIAEQVANEAEKNSSASLHSSIQKLSGGLSLGTRVLNDDMRDILSASITENVSLIKSISQKYLTGVQGAVMRSITTGNGLQDLVPYLAKHKSITLERARMIARDQSRKASATLNKAKMQSLGIKSYEWLHTGGSNHPRKEHIEMSGNVYRFDEPPIIDSRTGERGIPAQLPNCRCRMVPVIEFEGN